MYRDVLVILMILLIPMLSFAQSADHNYIRHERFLTSDGLRKTTSVDYYDGLGRKVQSVTDGATTGGRQVSLHCVYGIRDRQQQVWLPVGGLSSSSYQSTDQISQQSVQTYGDSHAYAEKEYDGVDRVLSVSRGGEEWFNAGKREKMERTTNGAGSVKRYQAPTDNTALSEDGTWPAGSLFGVKTTDEDGHTLEVFSDLRGLKILERRGERNDTYYVYNDYGQLRYVLSPEYQQHPDLSLYAYEYRYNAYGDMTRKTIPGCGYTSYWYDRGHRMTFMQDARLRRQGLYRFFLYDNIGRQVVQGLSSSCEEGREIHCATFTGNDSRYGGYSVETNPPISVQNLEIVYYYDNYRFLKCLKSVYGCDTTRLSSAVRERSRGLLTGSLKVASNKFHLYEACYYDRKGRVSRVLSNTLSNQWLSVSTDNSFTGKPLQTTYSLTSGQSVETFTETSIYDESSDLLVSSFLTVPGNTGLRRQLAVITYDALGRVEQISRSGGAGTLSYKYNLHGWPTVISGNGFTESLYYAGSVTHKCYNGNIGSIKWQIPGLPDGHRQCETIYTYDALNRLVLSESKSFNFGKRDYELFKESVIYNANGGITKLYRGIDLSHSSVPSGLKTVALDNLRLHLHGNQLQSVSDMASIINKPNSYDFHDGSHDEKEYYYDGSGSLTADLNKGIVNIDYDNQGNPLSIQFKNGNKTEYVYSPDGVRLRTTHITAVDGITVPLGNTMSITASQIMSVDSTDYIGSILYRNGSLYKYLFDGGYVSFSSVEKQKEVSPSYHYFTSDHLGNIRLVTDEHGNQEQSMSYNPFGTIIAGLSTNLSMQPYKYNGRELDRMHGLDLYDYGSRSYDADLAQWTSIDPQCEKYYNISPYAFCSNNPVNRTDIDGEDDYRINEFGRLEFYRRTNAQYTHRVFSGKAYITVGRNLVDQLTGNQTDYGTSAIVSNADDVFKFFKFVADHTKVEWHLMGIRYKTGEKYDIRTQFDPGKVSPNIAYYGKMTFLLHNHPRGSNPEGTRASGDYENYKKVKPGEEIDHYHDDGDVIVLNDAYNVYKKYYPTIPMDKYPKAFVYYAGDKNQRKQVFQYSCFLSKFKVLFNPDYKQIQQKVMYR